MSAEPPSAPDGQAAGFRPPEYDLAMQLMRVVHRHLERGGSPLVAMMGLIRAQESLVGMMDKVLKEAEDE